ncbi:MAG: hypothetical protein F6K31_36395 [Symploca sp. SIO2G7]|nr:hypothetical protein [Symploca sp. SIO2G7]
MLQTILACVLVGLMPPVLSLLVMRKAKERAQASLRRATQEPVVRVLGRPQLPNDRYHIEGIGYIIGDITCQFNACSAYIRCAVNPSGPCENCCYYEPQDLSE